MIKKAEVYNNIEIANLHFQTISKGFLPKLGIRFLQSLYSFLIQNELVLVYKEKQNVVGFVSCALSSNGIMKRFLFSSPKGIFYLILAILKNPRLIKSLFETYRAPSKSGTTLASKIKIPTTELLSISVSPGAQKGGIGFQLLTGLETELTKKGISRYKVIAGKKLEGANKFYLKNGFVLARQITIHGNDISNVYIKEIKS